MSSYKLIALDMDGTLLNSQKNISEDTCKAIEEAFAAGKEVVLSTGRCLAELEEYFKQIPKLRYLICTSGAFVYDRKEKKSIYENKMAQDLVLRIFQAIEKEDVMMQLMTTESIVQRDQIARMSVYHMGKHQSMFERVTTKVDDLYTYYIEHPEEIDKIMLHFVTEEARERSFARLKELPLELVDSEKASLEVSAAGVTKGIGLEKLCEYLQIPVEAAIAVGDSDNDLDVLKHAGLSVAMGNANVHVREISDVMVSDCDHDGCAEAIREYLL